MRSGEIFQEGENLTFIDKSGVTLNYLIKQCLDRIYEEIDIIFTEEQYNILYNQYSGLLEEYHNEMTSSVSARDVKNDNLSAKQEVVNDLLENVFTQILTNFNVATVWRAAMVDGLTNLVTHREDIYCRVRRNIIIVFTTVSRL